MNLKATQDCLIVRPDLEKSAVIALIRQKQTGTGVIMSAGPQATGTKAGDRILFGEFVGQDLKWDGEDLLVMREAHILGVFEQ
jgi:co-chaperonin GroES (HSP10)